MVRGLGKLLLVWASIGGGSVLHGQEAPPGEGAAKQPKSDARSSLRRVMDDSLNWYDVYLVDSTPQLLRPRVVMRWTNNTRGSEDGMTIVYEKDGRPHAICCVYPWQDSLEHNFESISRGKLLAKRDDRAVWQPTEPGAQFRPIPQAPVPDERPAARLRQMKSLAAQFSSTMLGWQADSSDREELRLLPQPLYRYETDGELVDGALFAFVQGTDPETLLLIETVRSNEAWQWHYAFVRRTSGELQGRWRDTVVWHAPRYPANNNPSSTYISLSRPLRDLLQERP
jgi:hypothetical protein